MMMAGDVPQRRGKEEGQRGGGRRLIVARGKETMVVVIKDKVMGEKGSGRCGDGESARFSERGEKLQI